jgi:group I intron endonuclease
MVIYKTTNTLNGKIYVGKDCNSNAYYLGSGIWLKRAIKKYGKGNFIKEVLEECDLSNINEREVYWIKELDARNPKVGYNIAAGGDGGQLGRKMTAATRKKMVKIWKRLGKAHRGKHPSEETRLLMSQQQKARRLQGENNPFYGKKHSEVTLRKLRKVLGGKNHPMYGMTGSKHPNFGKHLSEETRKKIAEAHKGTHFSAETKSRISRALMGNKSRRGLKHSEETKRKIGESRKRTHLLAKEA